MVCLLVRRLDIEQQKRQHLAALFLARKRFQALASAVMDDYWQLLTAMQPCPPALQKGALGGCETTTTVARTSPGVPDKVRCAHIWGVW